MILDIRVTHKRASIPVLESVTFKGPTKAIRALHSLPSVEEVVLLQTCHRTEIFTNATSKGAKDEIIDYWSRETGIKKRRLLELVEVAWNRDALDHLLSLTAGLESMMVGEDQILGQLRDAYVKAKEIGATGLILETAFMKAVNVGRRVRSETSINEGSVSIGSAGVDLATSVLGDLRRRDVLIIGAGELGTLVGKALVERRISSIFVANRAYERGVRLANMVGGTAVRFDRLDELLPNADVVLVATRAPHYILTAERVKRAFDGVQRDGELLVIDLAQPRNVEETVGSLPGVKLHTIDDLRLIAEENLKRRLGEVGKARAIVDEELSHLERLVRRKTVEPTIAGLYSKAEALRRRELEKALKMLGSLTERQKTVINKLTKILVKRILRDPIESLRIVAEKGDNELNLAARTLFRLEERR